MPITTYGAVKKGRLINKVMIFKSTWLNTQSFFSIYKPTCVFLIFKKRIEQKLLYTFLVQENHHEVMNNFTRYLLSPLVSMTWSITFSEGMYQILIFCTCTRVNSVLVLLVLTSIYIYIYIYIYFGTSSKSHYKRN